MRALMIVALAAALAACAGETPTGSTPPASSNVPSASVVAASVEPTQVPTPTVEPTPTAVPTPAPFTFSDGTHQIGSDLKAGTYETRNLLGSCYWERLSGFGGTIGDIISNASSNGGPMLVTIAKSDAGFTSRNCGDWTDPTRLTAGPTDAFPDGEYMVGLDIAAGTWKSDSTSGCYWERLSGFGGTLGEIITNGNADASVIVTISASDKGFESNRCGTWTKIK